jgi:hypothetical protein
VAKTSTGNVAVSLCPPVDLSGEDVIWRYGEDPIYGWTDITRMLDKLEERGLTLPAMRVEIIPV